MDDALTSASPNPSRRLRQLAEISRSLTEATIDLDSLLDGIVRALGDTLGDFCAIALRDDDGQILRPIAAYHPDPSALAALRTIMVPLSSADSAVRAVIETGKSVLIPNLRPLSPATDHLEYRRFAERAGVHSVILAPLRGRGTILGALGVCRNQAPQAYTADDLSFAQEIADRAALAIENARLYREIQRANADLIEQIAAGNAVSERLAAELAEHERLETALREATAAAETASHAKSEFMSRMSHELRTPLNAILGFAQVLQMDDLSADQQASLRHIYNGGQHLLTLINEVLEVAHADASLLALAPTPAPAITAASGATQNVAGPVLLLIEDKLTNFSLIERLLRPGGGILATQQGRLGIDLAREHQPALIVLDLDLPDVPGEEALARLRRDPATSAIPVVVLAADATGHQIARLRAAGARACLTKPLDLPAFLAAIKEILPIVAPSLNG